jgi:hypothetical protein
MRYAEARLQRRFLSRCASARRSSHYLEFHRVRTLAFRIGRRLATFTPGVPAGNRHFSIDRPFADGNARSVK